MLFVGDDWSEEHHDVELQDETGRRLGKAKLGEGIAGMARLHAMIGEHLDTDAGPGQMMVGIETDQGPWVQALLAAGYRVLAINPLQVARYRQTEHTSGGRSNTADAHTLADMVRTKRHRLRPVAGHSVQAEAMKVVTRSHKTLIGNAPGICCGSGMCCWNSSRPPCRPFDDLGAAEALELLDKAPDPAAAARLSIKQITAALTRARRRDVTLKAETIQAALRSKQLSQPPAVAGTYAAAVRAQVALLTTLNAQIATMQDQVEAHFAVHPDAEIYLSQPGLGTVLGAWVLAEFGDDKSRYTNAKARKNYAGTSPVTRQSGKKKVVRSRKRRLTVALPDRWAC